MITEKELFDALLLASQYLEIDGDFKTTNAMYIPPATALRQAADKIEQKEAEVRKIRKVIKEYQEQLKCPT